MSTNSQGANGSHGVKNLAVQTGLQREVTITKREAATAQAVKRALNLRQAARVRAYADAQQDATTAAANLSAAQLATQTLLAGLEKGDRALFQAQTISGKV